MTKQIYLHIGLPKAASTTLQSHLVEYSSELMKLGVLYPHTGRRLYAHDDIGFQVVEDRRFNPAIGDLATLKEEISQSQAAKVVISTESLAVAEIHQIQFLKDELTPLGETRIILYIRRQDLWLQSAWAQKVKSGGLVDTFEDFIDKVISQDPQSTFPVERLNADFYARIIRWENVFGKENIVVKILEKQAIQKNVFLDFLDILEVDFSNFVPLEDKNISPGIKTLEVIRYITGKIGHPKDGENPRLLTYHVAASIRNFAAAENWETQKINRVSKEIYQKVTAAFSESNAKLAQSYFDRDRLFQDPFEELPLTTFRLEDLTSIEVLDLFASVLSDVGTKRFFLAMAKIHNQDEAELQRRSMVQKKEISRLKEENAKLLDELSALKADPHREV